MPMHSRTDFLLTLKFGLAFSYANYLDDDIPARDEVRGRSFSLGIRMVDPTKDELDATFIHVVMIPKYRLDVTVDR